MCKVWNFRALLDNSNTSRRWIDTKDKSEYLLMRMIKVNFSAKCDIYIYIYISMFL